MSFLRQISLGSPTLSGSRSSNYKTAAIAKLGRGERVTDPDDQRLLRELRAGRPEACAEVVRAHYPAVYRLLVHLTRDVHLAEDLTQETFAAAWEKIAGFAGRSSVATWLHRIAYTKFIDARRADRRAANIRERLAIADGEQQSPLDAVAADDEAKRLHRALDELEIAERTAVVLHYLQGLSYREMAEVLDEPVGTMKWRTAEAIDRLRILLGEKVADHASGTTPNS
jgi:RNA polymerase sigma-70 factor, ECF subfamily